MHARDAGGRLTARARSPSAIGYQFADPALLARAMAHRSWCAEHPGTLSNERLEFLGDAVLGWVVADLAYRRFSDLPEGALTDVRKGVVNALALADVAEDLGLGEFLLLGRGEDAAGGREKPSILSDALEAVFGAVYVDGGPAGAYDVIERLIGPRLGRDRRPPRPPRLQVAAAGAGRRRRRRRRRSTSPARKGPTTPSASSPRSSSTARSLGEGTGRSKKAAEQAAAEAAGLDLDSADPTAADA